MSAYFCISLDFFNLEVYRSVFYILQRNVAPTSKRTQYASNITTSRLMLLHKQVSCNSKNRKERELTYAEMSGCGSWYTLRFDIKRLNSHIYFLRLSTSH